MNKKQYYALGIFFLVLLFLLPVIIDSSVHHDSPYFGARDGILSAIIWLSYPLMILFFIMAWLEKDTIDRIRDEEDHKVGSEIANFMMKKGSTNEALDRVPQAEIDKFMKYLKRKYPHSNWRKPGK